MPLFGSDRDASFIRSVNREMIQDIIGIEIALYKMAVQNVSQNIYGESSKKVYYSPIRIHAIITQDDVRWNQTDIGDVESFKTVKFAILRDDLVDLNTQIELSDVIKYSDSYYQVDNVVESKYWWGRDPDNLIGQEESEYSGFGYNLSVVVETHLTSISNLSIVQQRTGVNKIISNIPRNL